MEQLKIFALGALKMLVIVAMLITCIAAFTTGDGFFIATGVISLAVIVYKVYLLIRNTKNN